MADERVLEMIRRLKALADDPGAFPEERRRAALHLARQLAKHQLTMLDVGARKYAEDVVAENVVSDQSAPKGHWWSLLRAMYTAHDCRVVYNRRWDAVRKKTVTVVTWIGHASDVAVGTYLFDYCWAYLSKEAEGQGRANGYAGLELRRYRAEFITGAAAELANRLRAEREQGANDVAVAKGGPSQAGTLVVIKDAAVTAFVAERYPDLRSSRPRTHYVGSGSADGRRTGKAMEIRPGIRGQERGRLNGD